MNQWEQDEAGRRRRLAELAKIYPELSPAELEEAEYNLRDYVELVVRIVTRIKMEPDGEAKLRKLLGEEEQGESPE